MEAGSKLHLFGGKQRRLGLPMRPSRCFHACMRSGNQDLLVVVSECKRFRLDFYVRGLNVIIFIVLWKFGWQVQIRRVMLTALGRFHTYRSSQICTAIFRFPVGVYFSNEAAAGMRLNFSRCLVQRQNIPNTYSVSTQSNPTQHHSEITRTTFAHNPQRRANVGR